MCICSVFAVVHPSVRPQIIHNANQPFHYLSFIWARNGVLQHDQEGEISDQTSRVSIGYVECANNNDCKSVSGWTLNTILIRIRVDGGVYTVHCVQCTRGAAWLMPLPIYFSFLNYFKWPVEPKHRLYCIQCSLLVKYVNKTHATASVSEYWTQTIFCVLECPFNSNTLSRCSPLVFL